MAGNETASALTGGFAAAAVTIDRSFDRTDRRVRDASDDAKDAKRLATDAAAKLEQMGIGDIERIGADRFADFTNGVAYPATQPAPVPSTYPTPPVPPQRPIFSQDMASEVSAYPGTTNEYNKDGKLIDPGSPFTGQNFATGLAVSSVEVRAALMGLLKQQGHNPSGAHLEAIYRLFQGMTLGVEDNTQSQDEITEAIKRMLSPQSSNGWRKIAQLASASGILIQGAATESVFWDATVPANLLSNVGDQLIVSASQGQEGQNAADLTSLYLRLDSTSGAALAKVENANIGAGEPILHQLCLTYLGGSQLRVSGSFYRPQDMVPPTVVAFVPSVDHKLVFSVKHSTANAGNQTVMFDSTVWFAR